MDPGMWGNPLIHIHNYTHCEVQSDIKTWNALTLIVSLQMTVSPQTQLHQEITWAVGSVSLAEHPVGV